MAISKVYASRLFYAEEASQRKVLSQIRKVRDPVERVIDCTIVRMYVPSGQVDVIIPDFPSPEGQRLLRQKYRKRGWKRLVFHQDYDKGYWATVQ